MNALQPMSLTFAVAIFAAIASTAHAGTGVSCDSSVHLGDCNATIDPSTLTITANTTCALVFIKADGAILSPQTVVDGSENFSHLFLTAPKNISVDSCTKIKDLRKPDANQGRATTKSSSEQDANDLASALGMQPDAGDQPTIESGGASKVPHAKSPAEELAEALGLNTSDPAASPDDVAALEADVNQWQTDQARIAEEAAKAREQQEAAERAAQEAAAQQQAYAASVETPDGSAAASSGASLIPILVGALGQMQQLQKPAHSGNSSSATSSVSTGPATGTAGCGKYVGDAYQACLHYSPTR
jgi:hypothetical protein